MTNTGACGWWLWAAVVVGVGLSSCRDNGVAKSCGRDCVEGERCDVSIGKCVRNEPPAIRVDLPVSGVRIGAESFHLVGLVTDDENQWTNGRYSLDDGATWTELGVNAGGDFDQVVSVPLVDGKNVTLQLEVADLAGLVGKASVALVFDRVAPRCRIVTPASDALIGGQAVEVQVEVLDDSQVYGAAAYSLDNGLTWTDGTVTAGQATFTVPLSQGLEAPLSISVRAEDGAGNTCLADTRVRVDTRAPDITAQTPGLDEVIAAQDGGVYAVNFFVADTNSITSAEVQVPPNPAWQPVTLVNTLARFSWTLPAGDDGTARTVQLRATDEVGNVRTVQVPVTVDVVPPMCTFVAPAQNQVFSGAAPQVATIRWSVVDGSGRAGVAEVSTDGATWTQVGISAAGDAELAWTLDPTWDGVTKTLTVRGTDAAGNPCVARSRDVRVDLVAPTLAVTAPAADAVVGTATVQFQGTVADGSSALGGVTVDFADNQGPRAASVNGGTWTLVVPTSPTEDFVSHVATVRAVDAAGNAATRTVRVFVDRLAPQLTVPFPAEGELLGPTRLDLMGFVSVQAQVTDGDPNVIVEGLNAGSVWTAFANGTYQVMTSSLDNGASYAQQVRATDTAGNVSTLTRGFRVDRVAPEVTAANPTSGGLANATSVSLTFSEPVQVQGSTLPLSLTPVTNGATFTLDGTKRVLSVRGLLGGTAYSASLTASRVTDLAGNVALPFGPLTFSTRPARPANGAVLIDATAAQQVEWFRSSVDADGVISLVVRVIDPTTSQRSWLFGWVDPQTGAFTQQDVLSPAQETGASIISQAEVLGGVRQHRASVWLGEGPTGVVFRLGTPGSTVAQNIMAPALGRGEVEGSAYGTWTPSSGMLDFVRAPNVSVSTFTNPIVAVSQFSGDAWGVLQDAPASSGNDLSPWSHRCTCPGGTCSCSGYGSQPLFRAVTGCPVSLSHYVRTRSGGFFFLLACDLSADVPWQRTGFGWMDGAGVADQLSYVCADCSLGVASAGVDDEVFMASNPWGSNTSVTLSRANPYSNGVGAQALKTLTVEALLAMKPTSNPFNVNGRYVLEPVPGTSVGLLYVAAPGKLMYAE